MMTLSRLLNIGSGPSPNTHSPTAGLQRHSVNLATEPKQRKRLEQRWHSRSTPLSGERRGIGRKTMPTCSKVCARPAGRRTEKDLAVQPDPADKWPPSSV